MVNVEGLIGLVKNGDVVNLEDGLIQLQEDWEEDGDDRDLKDLPLFDGLPLLNFACLQKDVSHGIVSALIANGCDTNLSSNQGTPMQIIAKNGNHHLVDLLLENGAMLETETDPIFSENSPFYLASLYGQTEVIRKLLSYQPSTSSLNFSQEMVKDDGIRSCLLHAACQGGNLDIVKMWLSPSMDINRPKVFVSSLEECENGTPLYAACSGNHYEIAKFLYDMGAEITYKISSDYPEIARSILENCLTFRDEDFCENNEEPGHLGRYRNLNLGGFHFSWLVPVQDSLVELDLYGNKLTTLPSEIPWCLPNLVLFNASYNLLTKFSGPLGPFQCTELSEIQLSNNHLEDVCHEVFQLPSLVTLNLSCNRLKYLLRTQHQQFDVVTQPLDNKGDTSDFMQCSNLSTLNVSQNQLQMLPQEYIRKCSGLTHLNVSHNNLASFPNAWDCNMTNLDLSNNGLERCPISLEQYWCGTLRMLRLNDNKLDEINESVVKLGTLVELYAGNNKITRLPPPDLWECTQLFLLDLSHNNLGRRSVGRRLSNVLNRRKEDRIEEENFSFPSFLGNCLHDLDLSDNHLNQVHLSICSLVSLHHLDISHNHGIKTLPKELGRLQNNCIIKMDGMNISNIPRNMDADDQSRSKNIIISLRNDLRQCEKYYKMKLVILGKKDKGKTTLAGILKGQSLDSHRLLGIQRHDVELPYKSSKLSLFRRDQPTIKFSLWDLSGDPTIAATHHCFYTPNSLYILVWDLWSLDKELEIVGQYLYSIQAKMPHANILLVATFLDRNTLSTKQHDVSEIKQNLLDRYGTEGDRANGLSCRLDSENFIPVSCTTGEGIVEFKEKLYDLAIRIPDINNRPNPYLGRSIPKSYLLLEAAIKEKLKTLVEEKKQPFLDQKEFAEIISKIPNNDIDSQDEVNRATKFLSENGTILHFNDQLKGLNNLYFLDPTWLCEVLSKVLLHVAHDPNVRGGKISKSEVQRIYNEDEYVDQYIQLMERFEIALSVDFGGKLFIPSQLSKYPAIELNKTEQHGSKVVRLYKMAFIPAGFWSRLLSRLMYRIELLTTDWILKQSMTSSVTPAKFQRMLERHSSSSGLQIVKKDMIYWEDGLYLGHESGCLVVEATKVPHRRGSAPHNGVLITVQSTKEDYSIMGIVVDEIDDLLNDHYPGLMEWDDYGQARVQRYAICTECYDMKGSIPTELNHFSVEHCARLIMSSDFITCAKGSVPLIKLVPELLMQEIPKKFIIDISKLTVDTDKLLGIGVAGKVLKGNYGNVDVAVKLYHGAPEMAKAMAALSSVDSNYHTGGNQIEVEEEEESLYRNFSANTIDMDEANSMKAWRAFMEMRQEVLVTSKLHHPFIVSFLGISVRPSLLMCLEFAPLGNLRTVIDNAIVNREPFNKYKNKDKITPPVFEKEMAYKFLYQIASGLEYLHKNGIIYRDLKSDNILVFSLDLTSPVNVKLSDYGISRFCASGGTVGLVGTPGYQAPEIMDGQTYDEKVDIFSFSMVVYEILSGRRPFEEYKNLAQISKAIKIESKRPCLKDFNVDPDFPAIVNLMENCWDSAADKRPSGGDIISQLWMRSVQFLALKRNFKLPWELRDKQVDCVSFTKDSRHVEKIWLWEGLDKNRKFTTLDRYSKKDEEGCVSPGESLPGSKVTCMCQVDKDIWIGTEGYTIETFNHQCFSKKDKKPQCTFQTPTAIPTQILCIKEDSPVVKLVDTENCQEIKEHVKHLWLDERRVYVTLDTGKVMIFDPVNRPVVLRTLTRIIQSEIICGWRNVKTLTISERSATCLTFIPPIGESRNEVWVGCGDQICIVSDSTCLVEKHLKISQYIGKPIRDPIGSLVYSSDRVWCLINDSAIIVELDVDLRLPLYIFTVDEFCPKEMFVTKYIEGMKMACSEESIDMVTDFCNSVNTLHEVVTDLNPSDDNPPPVPRRNESMRAPPNPCVPPPVPNRLHFPPIIPPRSPKFDSTDNLSARPTGTILESDGFVKACSILHVGDTLWVGRNLGDILIINVNGRNSEEYGKVISVLTVSSSACLGNDVEVLLSTGTSVISFSKSGTKKGEIILWEPYCSKDVDRIKQYWSIKKRTSC